MFIGFINCVYKEETPSGTVLSALAMTIGAVTPQYYLFIVCNVIGGAAIGANLVVSTCLYGECIPNSHRLEFS